jgi:hypothetical protein
MTGRVIQGWFLSGQPKLMALVQPKMTAPPPVQTKTVTRPPGPPAPAFGVRAGTVQRHGAGGSFQVDPGRLGLVSSGGKPLPDGVRAQMEVAFRADFSHVRVHTGPQAERIGAIAFTSGNDIYFAPGRFQPDTVQGKQLLGHELAHVVQQRQGRVRNAPALGVAVVQDGALEAEADRLGRLAGALPQRTLVQPKMPGFRVGPPIATGDATRRPISATRVAPIQRRIWQFNGTNWSVVEAGSVGAYKPPPKENLPKGHYFFNDISNTTGKDIEDVRAGLADLMMMTGSLNELPRAVPWPDDLWRMLHPPAITKLKEKGGAPVYLGKVILLWGSAPYFVLDKDDAKYIIPTTLLKETWERFVKHFMEANGQLPYIRRQKWFSKRKASVIVDINFYYNRSPTEAFRFHKDTGGDNLFVNLIFNNRENMLAAEWIEDLKTDTTEKRKALKRNLPGAEEEKIRKTRGGFYRQTNPYRLEGEGSVRGGVVGPAAYVSWVDELIWHATPAPLSRTEYYKNILKPENYWEYKPYAVVAMRLIMLENQFGLQNNMLPTFHQFCNSKGVTDPLQIDATLCDEYMNTVQPKNKHKLQNFDAHETEVNALNTYARPSDQVVGYLRKQKKGDWAWTLEKAVDLDPDPFAKTEDMELGEKKTGIGPTIRRRNSFGNAGFKVSKEARSFIRTWVRVHRSDKR